MYWHAHAVFAVADATDETLEALLDAGPFDVIGPLDHEADDSPLSVRFGVDAQNPATASRAAAKRVTDALAATGVTGEWHALEVQTEAAFARAGGEYVPPLAGLKDVADILGVTQTRAWQLARERPDVLVVRRRVGGKPVFLLSDVHRLAGMERKPGRPYPPKDAAAAG